MTHSRLTIIVSGMIAGDPHQGGATWAVLQYVLGLRELGHRVLFLEPIDPGSLQPSQTVLAESVNARYFRQVASEFGLEETAALLQVGTRETVGLTYGRILEIAHEADLLINISGMLTDERLREKIPVQVYLDLDPAFIQIWHSQGINMRFEGHTHFVTIGQRIGCDDCAVPTCGLEWIKTNQPIVLRHWPIARQFTRDAFTTVGNWRGYGSVEFQGVFLGQKAHSLRPLVSLPRRTEEKFVLAMSIHPGEVKDLTLLKENDWQLVDPREVAHSPASYQQFIQSSKGEFGIAKSGYVVSSCGWFSDRSVCYLASGRPVIAQETGFSSYLPTGEGLIGFENIDDVLAGIESVNEDYKRHCRGARSLAEANFCADKVLSQLIDRVGACR